MKTLPLLCLLFGLSLTAAAQSPLIDSLERRLDQNIEMHDRLLTLKQLTKQLVRYDFNEAIHYARRGSALSVANDSLRHAHFFLLYEAICFINLARPDSSTLLFNEALRLARRAQDTVRIAETLNKLYYSYLDRGYQDSSRLVLLEAHRLTRGHPHPRMQLIAARALSDLGRLSVWDKNDAEAIEYGEEALALQEALRDSIEMGATLQVLSTAYVRTGEVEKGLAFQRRDIALNEAFNRDMPHIIAISYSHYGTLLLGQDRLAEAEAAFDQAVAMAAKANPQQRAYVESLLSMNRAELALKTDRPAEAVAYARPAMEAYRAGHNIQDLTGAYAALADGYAALERYDSAYLYRTLLKEATDSLYTQEGRDRELALQTEFNTERRDARIRELELIESRNALQRWAGIAVISLLLALLGFLFYSYRNNQRKKALIEAKNRENETLLKEIHHRVKNNLEVVSSLLELQTAELTDQNAVEAMRAGQSRVASMGLLHQRLYQGKELAVIDMPEYLQQLAESLRETYPAEHVTFAVHADDVALDVDTAVPVGLIVNELVTNSLKYAFTEAQPGRVAIELRRAGSHGYTLAVSDNGSTGAEATAAPKGTGFGTRLVQLLTRQLGGQLTEQRAGGWRTEVRFGVV